MPELRYAHVGSTTYNLRDDRLDTVEDSGAEFISRTATHDGAATIEAISGNAIVWNQLFDHTDNAIGTKTFHAGTTIVAGHRYYAATYFDITTAGNNYPQVYVYCRKDGVNDWAIRLGATAYTSHRVSAIYSARCGSTSDGTTQQNAGDNAWVWGTAAGGTVTALNFELIDLTRMFGAGNEPATVAEFEALYPEAYYAYDAGSLLPVNVEGMTSTGTGWTQTRAIDPAYMPLRKAGSVYDELTATKLTRRVGAVDLGSLTWSYSSSWAAWYSPRIADVEGAASNTDYPSIKHATLPVILPNDAMHPSYTDDGVSCQVRQSDGARILVKNGSSSIQPTGTLYYEKHTPTETTISPALNLSYRVENGGTETWEPPSGEMTAPVDTDVAYGWLSVLAAYVQS